MDWQEQSGQSSRPLLMGIVNLTPDSFHDGGRYITLSAAKEQLSRLIADGADMIDVGGMSSRPGHTPLSATEEIDRILPFFREVARDCPLPLAIDTDKAEVAAAALSAGATMINYTGGKLDKDTFSLAASYSVPLVIMHWQGESGAHADISGEVENFFRMALDFASQQGLSPQQLILDPGLGFAKNQAENMCLMRDIRRFAGLGSPLLYGFSHKRFVAALSNETHGQAPYGNLAAVAYAAERGAHILRLHDIGAARAFLDAWLKLKQWGIGDTFCRAET
jgi:dihydropteroate synthase